MNFFMLVTADKYSLPVVTADSWDELSAKTGKTKSTLTQAKSKKRNVIFDGEKCRVIKVRIEDEPQQQPSAKYCLQYYDASTPAWEAYKKERGIL